MRSEVRDNALWVAGPKVYPYTSHRAVLTVARGGTVSVDHKGIGSLSSRLPFSCIQFGFRLELYSARVWAQYDISIETVFSIWGQGSCARIYLAILQINNR
jgi:hypothetical protein